MDRRIAELAERQHGVVTRWQMLEIGLGRSAIESRIGRGHLHRVHQGVYAVGHRSLSRYGKWMAASLSAGPRAALSHRSAAQLWELMPVSLIPTDVTRPTRLHSREGLRGHCGPLPDDEITVVSGIPVTTVPRTVLDFAGISPRGRTERVLNEIEVRGLTDALSIPDLLARYPRRRGTAVLRAILADGSLSPGATRNEFEERFRAVLSRTGLPRPRFNADVAVGGRSFNVDCLWDRQRVIVELDGRAVHGTRRAFERDREKDRLLQAEGWRVVRVTWRQLRDDGAAIVADLRRTLQLASPPTL